MGTRSVIKFYDNWGPEEPVLCVYQQFDGYFEGVGKTLAEFLISKKMINGIGSGQTMENGHANGMGCLAAQFILENKTDIGGLYCTTVNDSQEYDYEVRYIDDKFNIKVDEFDGTPEEFLNVLIEK